MRQDTRLIHKNELYSHTSNEQSKNEVKKTTPSITAAKKKKKKSPMRKINKISVTHVP